ncbi:MAG: type IVB secretion system protein IcmJDotN, partial [Bacteroidota bacterium]
MDLLPITLTARQGNWSRYQARNRNKRFAVIAKRIFLRDQYRCRFCGFQDQHYSNVVNVDHDYSNNTSANMVTACTFCTQCFFLDAVGSHPRTGGHIIYLPEISQADLNNFCRILFSSLYKDVPYHSKLNNTYLSFKDRTKAVEDVFGEHSSDPAVFGQCLIDSHLTPEQLKHQALEDLRLLPQIKPFKEEIMY